jgi:protein-disulfide isomerase
MHKIRDAYGDRIRWIYKDFPLEMHKGAKKAAMAAHCAEEQGRFWEYQDMVYNSEEEPDADLLKKYASSLGLDGEQFQQCLNNGRYVPQIKEDIQTGKEVGICATPTFIINGKMLTGSLSFEEFKEEIDNQLEAAGMAA